MAHRAGPIPRAGLAVWRRNGCQACHQVHGFGGFLGPDPTDRATGGADLDELLGARGRSRGRDLPEGTRPGLGIWTAMRCGTCHRPFALMDIPWFEYR